VAIKFIKISDLVQCEKIITNQINAALSNNKHVLWLIPGGSNILLASHIMQNIALEDSAKLTVMLSDERYVPVGHPDSNTKQLNDAGFKPKNATMVPVLLRGKSLAYTAKQYNEAAKVAFGAADICIAFLGMGADGHIAGIKPGSPATKLSSSWVVGYEAPDFVRITLTPLALSHAAQAYVVAKGAAKRQALITLETKNLPLTKQPAQLLKKIPSAIVFNNQIGETS